MRIRRILLENFGSHARTEVSFTEGVNAIIGENGAGKTTILEAIVYALYPRSIRNQDDMIRIRTSRMRVELEFEIDGKVYLLVREREKGGNSSASLYELSDGGRKLLQKDQSKVSKQVEAILGIGRETFLQAIYVRQGEIAELLEQTPAKRRELIGRLLGIDVLEKIWSELKEVIGRLDTELQSVDSEIRGIGDVFKERSRLEGELETISRKVRELEGKESEVRERIEELKGKISALEGVDKTYRELKAKEVSLIDRIKHLTKRIEDRERELSRIESDLMKLPDLEVLASKYETLSEIREVVSELAKLRERITYLERRGQELRSYEREVSSLGELRKVFTTMEEEFQRLSSLRDDLIKKEEWIKTLKKKIDDVERDLSKRRNLLRHLLTELSMLLGLHVENPDQADRLISEETSSLEQKLGEVERLINGLREERSKLLERVEQNKRYLRDLSEELDRCPLCGSKLDPSSLSRLKNELSRQIEELNAKITDIKYEEAELLRKKSEIEVKLRALTSFSISQVRQLSNEIKEDEGEVQRLYDEVSGLIDEIRPLKEEVSKLETVSRKLDKLKAEISKKESLLPKIDEIRLELEGANLEALKERFSAMERDFKSRIASLGLSPESLDEEYKRSLSALKEVQRLKGLLSSRNTLLKDLEAMKEELNGVRHELQEVREKLEVLNYDPSVLPELKKELEFDEKILENVMRERNRIIGKIEEIESRIEALKDKEAKIRDLRIKKEKLERFMSNIVKVREVFSKDKGIQPLIRERARPSIEEELNAIFGSFSFDYDSVILDGDFTPHLKRGKVLFPFDRLSGGERISLALALRLAIARYLMMSRVETFILDEPTIHLDEERINALIETISSLNVPQMIIVTHSPRFRDIASHSILVSKVNGASKVEVMNEGGHISD